MVDYDKYVENLKEGFDEDIFIEYLKEGLIKTYPIDFTKRYLTKHLFYLGINNFLVDYYGETIFIKIKKHNKFNYANFKNLISVLNTCGYFPSIFITYDKNDKKINDFKYIKKGKTDNLNDVLSTNFEFIQIEAEAKYNLKLNIPPKLYHITETGNVNKILKIGLIPKTKSKKANHPDRIYFGFNKIGCLNLINQFDPNKSWTLLEIDTKDIKTIYTDPDYIDGCWTYENINPSNIQVIWQSPKKLR